MWHGLSVAAIYSAIAAVIRERASARRELGMFTLRAANLLLVARIFGTIAPSSALSMAVSAPALVLKRLPLP